MGKNYLLDTNAILDFMGDKLQAKAHAIFSQIIDDQINISVINKIELLGFSSVEPELNDFVSYSNVFPLDDGVVEKTIGIRRQYKIKLPDAIIAATALQFDFTLLTNDRGFEIVKGLKVKCPNDLGDESETGDDPDFLNYLDRLT